jgi:hypothetical protein
MPGHDLGNSIATRNLLDQYGRTASSIGAQAYNTDVNASLQAMNMSPMFQQQMMLPYNIWQQVGLDRRNMNQAQADAPYNALARYQNIVGGQNWGSSGSASTVGRQPYSGPSAGASTAGGALLGAQLGGYLNQQWNQGGQNNWWTPEVGGGYNPIADSYWY